MDPLSRPRFYILKGKTPYPIDIDFENTIMSAGGPRLNAREVARIREWEAFYGDIRNRRVGEDTIGGADCPVRISTVFLGMDHNFWGEGPPILFETMIFGGALDTNMRRYATWDEAEAGHKEMLAQARAALFRLIKGDKKDGVA